MIQDYKLSNFGINDDFEFVHIKDTKIARIKITANTSDSPRLTRRQCMRVLNYTKVHVG